ncbi:uncharacterized protein WCC33_013696 [Rhinophrynus dorsalis]
MGNNNVRNVSDTQTESPMEPKSPGLYKPHLSPVGSPMPETFHTPLGSPEFIPTPMDTEPISEELSSNSEDHRTNLEKYDSGKGWDLTFNQAIEKIQKAADVLNNMHSQLEAILRLQANTEGTRIIDSAFGWEARLGEVRRNLRSGLRDLGNVKEQYVALNKGDNPQTRLENEYYKGKQEDRNKERLEWIKETAELRAELRERDKVIQDFSARVRTLESTRPESEDTAKEKRLQDHVCQLETENEKLREKITELQGEVQDLTLLQSDLRTAVSVAERFREEAQEKLERTERENRRLRGKGPNVVDWTDSPSVNVSSLGYRSLPRGVILSAMQEPIVKSRSLMSVPPPPDSSPQDPGPVSRRERRGSLETLLNESKATENLTEDSGSFFRRYGGSKRGVFLRWAQDRTCGYKYVVITNFSSSWVDGMALCALLHSYLPERIPYAQLRPLEKRKNLQLAFQVAESEGIPALLTPDHMLQTQGPDWQKVLLYVESIYQKFEA